ncbi:MlaD family protein [Fibrobacterales bacterium]|nr:MlaD family protein [Fibrobacterales bacterium]
MHDLTKSEKTRLGAFLLTTVSALVLFSLWLVMERFLKETRTYHTEFSESVDGLVVGAEVRMSGVKVGRITSLNVHPTHVGVAIVYFEVGSDVPVKADMTAVLSGGLNITGLKTVALSGGSDSAILLKDGSLIPSGSSQVQRITGQAEAIVRKVEEGVNRMIHLLDQKNQDKAMQLVESANSAAAAAAKLMTEEGPKFGKLAGSSEKSMRELTLFLKTANKIIKDFDKHNVASKIGGILEDTKSISNTLKTETQDLKLKESIQGFNKLVANLNRTMARSQDNIDRGMKSFKETAENMEDFSRQIRENPSLLLRTEEKEERQR